MIVQIFSSSGARLMARIAVYGSLMAEALEVDMEIETEEPEDSG
jgi:hypothetical protein